jgi:polyhydroxybutyrate depolymerase
MQQLAINGLERSYALHVPARRTKIFLPLVLLFHGRGTNGRVILSRTGFAAKADAKQFIVVAPDGVNGRWNDGRGTVNPGIDDVGFVKQLVASLKSQLPVDATRIYAAGISNGGLFTQRLACEFSDVLAAVATVAGPLPSNLAQSRPNPMSVVGIQGDADPRVPIDGTRAGRGGGQLQSAVNTMKFWASINACNANPTVTHLEPAVNDGTRVDKYTYSGGSADLDYYIVRGMGHAWPPNPSGENGGESGLTSQNIDATDVIWNFLHQHSRLPTEVKVVAPGPARPFAELAKLRRRAKVRQSRLKEREPR